jgi:opacity protein-like surface antigen
MSSTIKLLSLCIFLTLGQNALAQDTSRALTLEIAGTFTHFEQQIKTEIGGVKGELLAADTEFGIQFVAAYTVWKYFHAGWYFQYENGNRANAQFSGFDSTGAAQVVNLIGGSYYEFWTGPLLRVQYKQVFLEAGYGLVGMRNDDAREDLVNTNGSNEGNLSTDPSVAWFVGLGAQVKIHKNLLLLVKAQYRVRYYNKKDGAFLQNEAVHGTQNFSPIIGLSYKFLPKPK